MKRPRRSSTAHVRAVSRSRSRLKPRTRIILAVLATGVALLLWAILARVFAPQGNTTASRFDAIIILGAHVDPDGTPTPALVSRITEGVHEYDRGVAGHVIVSGGPNGRYIQAAVMARLLEAQGVPSSAIVLEPKSENTIENACFSVRIMKQYGWKTAEVVTSTSHLPRSKLIFSRTPILWHGHAAPSLAAPGEDSEWDDTVSEILHTGYYLLYSQWAERCSP
ncbi:MAG TPA: YdcF family protein [Terracidiphilus sp.]|jgi:uncharacterized SAM-binding protein YcdF (DUF218 family)